MVFLYGLPSPTYGFTGGRRRFFLLGMRLLKKVCFCHLFTCFANIWSIFSQYLSILVNICQYWSILVNIDQYTVLRTVPTIRYCVRYAKYLIPYAKYRILYVKLLMLLLMAIVVFFTNLPSSFGLLF